MESWELYRYLSFYMADPVNQIRWPTPDQALGDQRIINHFINYVDDQEKAKQQASSKE